MTDEPIPAHTWIPAAMERQPMKVLVCGDRKWSDERAIHREMYALKCEVGTYEIIEGGARGADTFAWEVALRLGLPVYTAAADWKAYGRRAGPIRNRKMLDLGPDLVLAFHANIEKSRGTKDCVTEAMRRGIPVRVVRA